MEDRPKILLGSDRLAFLKESFGPDYDVLPAGSLDPAVRVILSLSEPIAPDLIDRLPNLGLVAVVGSGYDGIDRAMLDNRGILLSNTAGANAEDVADLALALILGLVRGTVALDARVRSGSFSNESMPPPFRSMTGLRVGVVGLGMIGEACARRLQACGSDVSWWGPRDKPDQHLPRSETLFRLAQDSDLIVVAARSEEGAPPLISAEVIEALGPRGMLVNVARGHDVDEDALIAALRNGRLAGAALDVFREEPPTPQRWADVPNVVLSPHLGGYTDRALAAMVLSLKDNVTAYLEGRTPRDLVRFHR